MGEGIWRDDISARRPRAATFDSSPRHTHPPARAARTPPPPLLDVLQALQEVEGP